MQLSRWDPVSDSVALNGDGFRGYPMGSGPSQTIGVTIRLRRSSCYGKILAMILAIFQCHIEM